MNFTNILEKLEEATIESSGNDLISSDYEVVSEDGDPGLFGNNIAIALIYVPSIIGLAFSFISLYIIYKTPSLKNAFGYLCLIHTIGEGSVLLFFLFWSTPFSYIDSPIPSSTFGRRIGDVVGIFFFITQYAQLLKAINRFVAISNPMLYRRLFNDASGKYLICIVIMLSGINEIFYMTVGCNYFYDSYSLAWIFDEEACGENIPFYTDFLYACSLITSVIIIDAITCIFLYLYKKSLAKENKSHKRKELLFFFQTCLSSIFYFMMLILFHLTWRLTDDIWIIYLSNTTAWCFCHLFDGMVMVAFNYRYLSSASTITRKTFTVAPASSVNQRQLGKVTPHS